MNPTFLWKSTRPWSYRGSRSENTPMSESCFAMWTCWATVKLWASLDFISLKKANVLTRVHIMASYSPKVPLQGQRNTCCSTGNIHPPDVKNSEGWLIAGIFPVTDLPLSPYGLLRKHPWQRSLIPADLLPDISLSNWKREILRMYLASQQVGLALSVNLWLQLWQIKILQRSKLRLPWPGFYATQCFLTACQGQDIWIPVCMWMYSLDWTCVGWTHVGHTCCSELL